MEGKDYHSFCFTVKTMLVFSMTVNLSINVFNPECVTQDLRAHCIVGNPPYLLNPEIIGAEDDYFDSQQEQVF